MLLFLGKIYRIKHEGMGVHMREKHSIIIRETYKDYSPPIPISRAIDKILAKIPSSYLSGLKTIVITNSANLPHYYRKGKTRSRGKYIAMAGCQAFYHKSFNGESAWIQLLLDNMLYAVPKWALRIPFIRDLYIAPALFHEIGHHIHGTKAPEYKEPETVADQWKNRLLGHYLSRQYWYLVPLFRLLKRRWNQTPKATATPLPRQTATAA